MNVTEDRVEATEISIDQMTKQQLITRLSAITTAHDNLVIELENTKENNAREIEQINKFYGAKLKDFKSLTDYYERKFKVIGLAVKSLDGLLIIEEGEGK